MYILNTLLALLFLFTYPTTCAHAKMYKWVDENGGIHWSDRPPTPEAKAEALEVYETIEDNKRDVYFRDRSYSTSKTKDRKVRRIVVSKNPIAEVSKRTAERDLKLKLMKRYGSHYSTIKMLLDAGMKSYDFLCQLPNSAVNNEILLNLKKRYYPHFSTIKMLYASNKKAYKKLNQ